ncbi:helix-turn-helix transcriptional regulator [Promicromonospora sp. CA-289599]|uniref:helix-turn-helix transcriptional regulator n=1 Tax=Promicromonospora sp. CA-289599 TaxID=3240014 RepID=UPI003D8BC145
MTTQEGDWREPAAPRSELNEFLRSRRARLRPEDVGVQSFGRRRRVPGLRREEISQLAGVSVAYYTRLEQGNGQNVSAEILESIARALRLSESERAHLFHLARPRPAQTGQPGHPAQPQRVREDVVQLLDLLDGVPAYVWGRRGDILAWNDAAAALFDPWFDRPDQDRNWTRIVFLDARSRDFFFDWESKATEVVSQLRLDAGMHPHDPLAVALVAEAQEKSPDFRRMWASHDVQRFSHGELCVRHDRVGALSLRYETLTLPDDHEQAVTMYRAEPGPAVELLRLVTGVDQGQSRRLAPGT